MQGLTSNTGQILRRFTTGYLHPPRHLSNNTKVSATVCFYHDKCEVRLNVGNFKPEDISVHVAGDNTLTIEGKQEEKYGTDGAVTRHFIRTYVLPKNCDLSRVESSLSSNGILSITAPKTEVPKMEPRNIPIKQTGKPAKT